MSIILEFQEPPGKPIRRGFDHIWKVIRDLDRDGSWWTIDDIRRKCRPRNPARSSVKDFVTRLVAGGFARQAEDTFCYRIVEGKAQKATPCVRRDGTEGLQGRGQTHMWNVIRGPLGRNGFTAKDLTVFGATETVAIELATAKSYVKRLAKAGYLACLKAGKGGQPSVWKLKPAMNTGPLPPMILRSDMVFDQNREAVIGSLEASEVAS